MAAVAAQNESVLCYRVRGMTCASCALRVEAALTALPGVRSAQVDLGSGRAIVWHSTGGDIGEALQQAVAAAGYSLEAAGTDETVLPNTAGRGAWSWRPPLAGAVAVLGLLTFYLGITTLAQGWDHALSLLGEDRWFIAAIAVGFGVQVCLFTYLRQLHARATVRGLAASSGTSTAAMLACCAHHLSDILPIVGLAGAAVFLGSYKTQILWFGIVASLGGVAYMASQVRRHLRSECNVPARSVQV